MSTKDLNHAVEGDRLVLNMPTFNLSLMYLIECVDISVCVICFNHFLRSETLLSRIFFQLQIGLHCMIMMIDLCEFDSINRMIIFKTLSWFTQTLPLNPRITLDYF